MMMNREAEIVYCLLNDIPVPPRRRSLTVSQIIEASLHVLRSGDFKGRPIGTVYLEGNILALEFQSRQNWCDGIDKTYLDILLQDKEVNAELQARIQASNAKAKEEVKTP